MADHSLQQIEEIFQAAADLPADARGAYLDRRCAGNPDLRRRLDDLLSHIDSAPDDIVSRGVSHPFNQPLPDRIGRYRILRLIGQGGMGAVYEAEQDSPRRSIALKVIRPGLLSPSVLARFERESQLLSRLHHPGIAQIYEAGAEQTAHGPVPYFAMELIRGEPLDTFTQRHNLSARGRLSLIADICDAVQHAHDRGVLHRDLKPANILVEENDDSGTASHAPRPRILDFGIARATDSESHTLSQTTETGQLLGTVPYMSPEQVAGDTTRIDTRSDVYALGVILFELLTGRLPYDIRQRPIAEAARIIRDQEPTRLGSLDTHLRGDIDTIVAKAIEKDPARRYASAADLAADIRRHLTDLPINARPPSALYQLSKFARRHRALVTAAASIFIALIAGLIVSTTLYFRAERALAGEAAQARIAGDRLTEAQSARTRADRDAALADAVVDYFISDIIGAAAPQHDGPDVKVIDVLNRAADGIGDRFKDRPEVEARIRIELANAYNGLALAPRAEDQARRALALLDPIAAPGDELTIRAQTHLCTALGFQHKFEEQADRAAAALEAAGGLKQSDPARIRLAAELAKAQQTLGRHDQAQATLREALDTPTAQHDDDIASMLHQELLASLAAQNKVEESLPIAAALLDHDRHVLGPAHPATLAATNNYVNLLSRAKRYDEAARLAADLPALVEKTFGKNHPAVGFSSLTLATALLNAGRPAEAEAPALKAAEVFGTANEASWELERCLTTLCDIYAAAKRPDDLAPMSIRLVRQRFIVAGEGELPSLTAAMDEAAKRLSSAGRAAEPADLATRLWTDRDTLTAPGSPHRARFLANLSRYFTSAHRPDDARAALNLAHESLPTAARRADDERIAALAAEELGAAVRQ